MEPEWKGFLVVSGFDEALSAKVCTRDVRGCPAPEYDQILHLQKVVEARLDRVQHQPQEGRRYPNLPIPF